MLLIKQMIILGIFFDDSNCWKRYYWLLQLIVSLIKHSSFVMLFQEKVSKCTGSTMVSGVLAPSSGQKMRVELPGKGQVSINTIH